MKNFELILINFLRPFGSKRAELERQPKAAVFPIRSYITNL